VLERFAIRVNRAGQVLGSDGLEGGAGIAHSHRLPFPMLGEED
jgi:hypothetical protein